MSPNTHRVTPVAIPRLRPNSKVAIMSPGADFSFLHGVRHPGCYHSNTLSFCHRSTGFHSIVFFFSFPACSCTRIVKRYWWGKGAPRRLNTAGIKSAVKWTRSWFLQAIVYCLRRKSRSQTGARCVTVKEPCLSCGPPPKNGKGKCGDLAAKCGLA